MTDQLDEAGLPIWPAPERNKAPLAEILLPRLRELHRQNLESGQSQVNQRPLLLEVSSATGQHLAHFAPQLPEWDFQPSDYDPEHQQTLESRVRWLALPQLLPPFALDVTELPWPVIKASAIFNANMLHIAPWEAAVGLFKGSAQILESGAPLYTYGPYKMNGQHTAPSNAAFDDSLRERDARWGVRDVSDLEEEAAKHQLELLDSVAMPANNFFLEWRRK
ncbi:MAG: class I SAM-dependent methyltransferase [Polyangiaceae bacterium]|nr:class I SAM-dependent methyltransferase [Polyangiaceae bacterium]